MRRFLKYIVDKRVIILAISGISLYIAISKFQISLWYILLAGTILGLVFGKVFCRWVCPVGLIMELIMSVSADGKTRQMYQYHKLGCPIAWVSGWLNKFSFFKIRINAETCTSCGVCDKQCYLVAVEPSRYSLYRTSREAPGSAYSCSKCLKCVTACPNGSLRYKV